MSLSLRSPRALRLAFALLAAPLALAACGGGTSDTGQPATATAPADAPAAQASKPAPSADVGSAPAASAPAASASAASQPRSTLLGRWVSASCGERRYERQLSFEEGGRFASLELVSPCPPGARCVWSGIVQRLGRYEQAGDRVKLVVDQPVDGHGVPLPDEVRFDGRVIEGAKDGSDCGYAYQP
jgi:hypothetical protein